MRSRIQLFTLVSLAFAVVSGAAAAQSVTPEEMIRPDGAVSQNFVLTAAQKNAIYNAILQQRVRLPAERLSAAVGAAVPSSIALVDLPDQATANDPAAALLKYAMVERDIVVVDPVSMRVVDVIRGGFNR
jgi:hypothetical protein